MKRDINCRRSGQKGRWVSLLGGSIRLLIGMSFDGRFQLILHSPWPSSFSSLHLASCIWNTILARILWRVHQFKLRVTRFPGSPVNQNIQMKAHKAHVLRRASLISLKNRASLIFLNNRWTLAAKTFETKETLLSYVYACREMAK